jgi:hypothetical protein
VKLLREVPEDALNGFGVSVRAQLQQLIVIDEFIGSHANTSPEWLWPAWPVVQSNDGLRT